MEQIAESNQLIAEFDGYTFEFLTWRNPENEQDVELFRLYYKGKLMGTEEVKWHYENLLSKRLDYQKNWNLLMPVVEKIEGLGVLVKIEQNYCTIHCGELVGIAEKSKFIGCIPFEKDWGSKLLSTYNAVLQFIKWYNENKQP